MIFRLILALIFAFGLISTTFMIGKEREPIDTGTAILSAVINLVLIYGLYHWL